MTKVQPRGAAQEKLEKQVALPNGALADRCQSKVRRTGKQCGRAARVGFAVCAMHGAGTAAREAEGTRKASGRPITHGLYSQDAPRTLEELRAKVEDLNTDLDNSDAEMATIKSVLAYLFQRAGWLNEQAGLLEAAVEAVGRTLEDAAVINQGVPGDGELTTHQARQVAEGLTEGRRLLAGISSYTTSLLDANIKSINGSRLRAETKAKKAEAEAVAVFGLLCTKVRNLITELAPDNEWHDLFEYRLAREIGGPAHLELPDDPTVTPDELLRA